jgi:hypothetical protein
MISKLKTINAVVAKIVQNLDIKETVQEDDFIEWISDAYRFIGASEQLIFKEEIICINNYRGEMPCDYKEIIDLIDCCTVHNSEYYEYIYGKFLAKQFPYNERHLNYTSLINNQELSHYNVCNHGAELKEFRIENNFITTSFQYGYLRAKYKAFPIDTKTGYLLVPDDEAYDMAFMWYVMKFLAIQGKLKNGLDFNYCNQQWLKYCLQARGNANFPNNFTQNKTNFTLNRFKSYF